MSENEMVTRVTNTKKWEITIPAKVLVNIVTGYIKRELQLDYVFASSHMFGMKLIRGTSVLKLDKDFRVEVVIKKSMD